MFFKGIPMKAYRWMQCARPGLRVAACSRQVASLPQIPGVILANQEIPEDRLVSRIRQWASSSRVNQAAGAFDVLQLAEKVDGRSLPRAICCLLRTQMHLADSEEALKVLVTVYYRARDYLNREFWEDQVRRLSDILADEYLGGGRGVHLMVHQNAPKWALGLEVGDHRLLAELEALTVLGVPGIPGSRAEPELIQQQAPLSHSGHVSFNRISMPTSITTQELSGDGAPRGSVQSGHYVLRDDAGAPICGIEVLGVLPTRLVCGSAWAAEGSEAAFGALVDGLRRRAGKLMCSVLADPRDAGWQRLCGRAAAPLPGIWRSRRSLGVAITGMPLGLEPHEQACLARAPFLVPWEFVPFHFGSLVVI